MGWRHRSLLSIAFLSSLTIAGTATAADKVSLQLRWDHQFQFAGYYAALWQGYYRAVGLEVDVRPALRPGGAEGDDAVRAVQAGEADFGIGDANVLLGDERGPPLAVLASIFQTSGAALYARADTPLERPADLLALRPARKPGDLLDVEVQAMLRAEGVDIGRVATVPLGPSNVEDLAAGRVDAVPGYRAAFPFRARQLGLELRELRPSSYGVDFYGDSLFARRDLVERRPAVADAFLKASLDGWRYAFDHPEEVARRIVAELPVARALPDPLGYNLFQAAAVRDLVQPDRVTIGHTNPDRWRRMAELLRDDGILRRLPDIDALVYDPHRAAAARWQALVRLVSVAAAVPLVALTAVSGWVWQLRRRVRRATAGLRASEDRFRDFAEAASEWLWEQDASLRFTWVSPTFETVTGISVASRLGRRQDEVVQRSPEVDEALAAHLDDLAQRRPFRDFVRPSLVADGTVRWLSSSGKPVLDAASRFLGYRGVGRDVTRQVEAEEQVRWLAYHDALTGLPNRAMFHDELCRARARAERDGSRLAVMLVDLDRFKAVNDTYGHATGDKLLVEVALRLQAAVREGDLVARLGGDEFAVLAPGQAGPDGFATLARRVLDRLAAPLHLGTLELRPGGSVGLTVYPDDPGSPEALLVDADRALYAAKAAGRGGWAAYANGMRDGRRSRERTTREAMVLGDEPIGDRVATPRPGHASRRCPHTPPPGSRAAYSRDREAMHLEVAERRLTAAADRLAVQEATVARLAGDARGRRVAEELLATMRRSLDLMLACREAARYELGDAALGCLACHNAR